MSKKFSKRETRIIRLMIFVIIVTGLVEAYDRFMKAKEDLRFQIASEMTSQGTYLDKLKESPETYNKKAEELGSIMAEAEERILRMNSQNDAQYKFQEDITNMADNAGIHLNSLNKRRAKELFKGSDMIQLQAYFGYNCPIVNFLDFLEQTSQKEYFVAVYTLNVNVNSRRRRTRDKKAEDKEKEITIRGSCVLTTLYKKQATDIGAEDDGTDEPIPDIVPEEPEEPAEIIRPPKGNTTIPPRKGPKIDKGNSVKLIKTPRPLTHNNPIIKKETGKK